MDLILPVAGNSTRFPRLKPKWLLRHPTGHSMFYEAIRGLSLANVRRIVLVAREDHLKLYNADREISRELERVTAGHHFELLSIPPTMSQPESVARALEALKSNGPFYVKDCDNYFVATPSPENAVATIDLHDVKAVDAASKSYVETDRDGRVLSIVEKQVISSQFCCGGYGFASTEQFLRAFHELRHDKQLYLSHVIFKMMLDGVVFHARPAKGYIDWGTLDAWRVYLDRFQVIFVDLESVAPDRANDASAPTGHSRNVEFLNRLVTSGTTRVVIMTSRQAALKVEIEQELRAIGLKYDYLLCGISSGKKIIFDSFNLQEAVSSTTQVYRLPRHGDAIEEFAAELLPSEISGGDEK